MNSCERYAPYLPGFAGGDLRADTTRIVSSHLDTCHPCRDEVARQRTVVGGLRALSLVYSAPEGLADEVIAAVGAHSRLGEMGAALPYRVADRARHLADAEQIRRVAGAVGDRVGQVSDSIKGSKAKQAAAAAATTAALAGGIAAIVSRRRKVARGTASA
jgi:anti-sigma factor RsiW